MDQPDNEPKKPWSERAKRKEPGPINTRLAAIRTHVGEVLLGLTGFTPDEIREPGEGMTSKFTRLPDEFDRLHENRMILSAHRIWQLTLMVTGKAQRGDYNLEKNADEVAGIGDVATLDREDAEKSPHQLLRELDQEYATLVSARRSLRTQAGDYVEDYPKYKSRMQPLRAALREMQQSIEMIGTELDELQQSLNFRQ